MRNDVVWGQRVKWVRWVRGWNRFHRWTREKVCKGTFFLIFFNFFGFEVEDKTDLKNRKEGPINGLQILQEYHHCIKHGCSYLCGERGFNWASLIVHEHTRIQHMSKRESTDIVLFKLYVVHMHLDPHQLITCSSNNMPHIWGSSWEKVHNASAAKSRRPRSKSWHVINMHVNTCHKKCCNFGMTQSFFWHGFLLNSSIRIREKTRLASVDVMYLFPRAALFTEHVRSFVCHF